MRTIFPWRCLQSEEQGQPVWSPKNLDFVIKIVRFAKSWGFLLYFVLELKAEHLRTIVKAEIYFAILQNYFY